MVDITFPSAEHTTAVADGQIAVIGFPVTWYVPTIVASSGLNPITGDALDSFSPVDRGTGKNITYSGATISGHVTHKPSEEKNWLVGGIVFEGDCRIRVKYTEENLEIVRESDYHVADGKQFEVIKIHLRGTPERNRIIVDSIERKKED